MQILVDRFNGAPRHEKYRKYKQGIFKVSRKTGVQLIEIFKKLLLLGQGIIPARDWYGTLHMCGTWVCASAFVNLEYSINIPH